MSPNSAGTFGDTPSGVILHGTRSGRRWTIAEEFRATCEYVRSGSAGLAWHATIGEGELAVHLPCSFWGWNARTASPHWLAVEFAQPTVDNAITDAQVAAFVWFFRSIALVVWPHLPGTFIAHSELPDGKRDGKTDPFAAGDPRMDDLRHRILSLL